MGWQVWEVKNEGGVRQLFSNVVMGSDVPVALHGGAALGVTFSRLLRPGAPHSAKDGVRHRAHFTLLTHSGGLM